jgi:steroid 5-alpha reductase family enzyme
VIHFAVAALLFLVALWAIQVWTRDAATADAGWAVLVAAGTITAAVEGEGATVRRALVAGLVTVWALRLALHLLRDRVWSGRGEDGRYAALRAHWGPLASRNFLFLYLAQGIIAALFIIPASGAMRAGALDLWDAAGVVLWIASLSGEWVADAQLARFRADAFNRGRVCRDGLWGYSRHPNYFCEWLHWWAFVLIGGGAWITLLGPAAMLLFLFRITGIPYTERQALKSRGEAYREYQRTTSAFIPWPPRRKAA